MSYRLKTNEYELLVEALRRFECFAVRRDKKTWTLEDLTTAWTGMGSMTTYRPAMEAKLMEPATPSATSGRDGWWRLTARGAEIVLGWHALGFGCGENGFSVVGIPPRSWQ